MIKNKSKSNKKHKLNKTRKVYKIKKEIYYLSLLSIFKNETMCLRNWLEHYLWQGVEHFYLIDNGSTDKPLRILQEYIDKGIVTCIYLPEKHKQVEHYRYVFDKERLKEKTKWLAICDLDEYFYGFNKKLNTQLKELSPDYDYVLCKWLMFGSDGHKKQPKDVRISITHRKKGFDKNTKYIFKPKIIKNSSPVWIHNLKDAPYINKKRIYSNNKLIKINHYPVPSVEYFQKVKITRGDANNSKTDNFRDMNYFKEYDHRELLDERLKNLILNPPSDYS